MYYFRKKKAFHRHDLIKIGAFIDRERHVVGVKARVENISFIPASLQETFFQFCAVGVHLKGELANEQKITDVTTNSYRIEYCSTGRS